MRVGRSDGRRAFMWRIGYLFHAHVAKNNNNNRRSIISLLYLVHIWNKTRQIGRTDIMVLSYTSAQHAAHEMKSENLLNGMNTQLARNLLCIMLCSSFSTFHLFNIDERNAAWDEQSMLLSSMHFSLNVGEINIFIQHCKFSIENVTNNKVLNYGTFFLLISTQHSRSGSMYSPNFSSNRFQQCLLAYFFESHFQSFLVFVCTCWSLITKKCILFLSSQWRVNRVVCKCILRHDGKYNLVCSAT